MIKDSGSRSSSNRIIWAECDKNTCDRVKQSHYQFHDGNRKQHFQVTIGRHQNVAIPDAAYLKMIAALKGSKIY